MQTLGLSSESRRSDGPLKSIFWPLVDNAWDVDYLGRQGLTICTVVALLELVPSLFSGSALLLVAGLLMSLIFLVGGMGVREASWHAAAMVFSLYFVGLLDTLAEGRIPGILSIVAAGVLLSNLRAAFLASQWKPAGPDEDRPTRFNDGLMDFLVDQLPQKAWPALQIAFFALGSAFLALSFVELGIDIWHRFGSLLHAHP
ncbi:MAG: hypothetical protein WBE72_09700 [Terracidiphilus sp.]